MNNFIVFEGICCSGKTTTCKILGEKFDEIGYKSIYNHGAMTYTDIGREFKKDLGKRDMTISLLYFFTDLLINTKNIIKPKLLDKNTIILQDRYYDAITTYINAYGEYFNKDYNVYRIAEVLLENNLLLKPSLNVFCIPPFEVIKDRMDKSKDSPVHDFYRQHPEFLRTVYDELVKRSKEYNNAIVIDTSSDVSVNEGIDKIISFIKE